MHLTTTRTGWGIKKNAVARPCPTENVKRALREVGKTEKVSGESSDQSGSSNGSFRAASFSKVCKTVLPVRGQKGPLARNAPAHEDSDAAVEHLEDAARHDAHLRPRLQHRELGAEAAPLLFHFDVQRAGLAA